MKYLFWLLLILFPFGQFFRSYHLNDLVVGVIGTVGVVRGVREKNKLIIPLAVFAGLMALTNSVYAGRWLAYAGLYFFTKNFIEKRHLMILSLAIAVIGVLQYIFLPDVSFLAAAGWDDHYYRLTFPFLDPGFTGIILTLGLFVIFDQFGKFALFFLALLLTYSRASYLAYLVGFGAISFYKKSVKIFLLAALVLIIGIFLLPRSFGEGTKLVRENSVWARVHNWQETVQLWRTAPVFGVGMNEYQGKDSSLLMVLATTGLTGLIIYFWVVREVWGVGKKNMIFKASFLAVFVHSWFNNTLFYPFVMEWLWLLLALSSFDSQPDRSPQQ